MSCINREEAIRLIMEYQGGAMDKPTAKKVLEGMDGIEICEDTISRQAAIDVAKQHWYKPDIAKALEDLPSAQPEPHWISCEERLPEDLEEVNVTWVNHIPEPYYDFLKDKPFTGSAVYYRGEWFWYSSRCVDILAEYGVNDMDKVDDGVEITAWMPLSEPYKEEQE